MVFIFELLRQMGVWGGEGRDHHQPDHSWGSRLEKVENHWSTVYSRAQK